MPCIFLLRLSKVFMRDLPINNHICKLTRPPPPRTYHPRVPPFFSTYIISKEIIGNLRCVMKWNHWLLRYLSFAPDCKYTIERLLTLEYNGELDWLPCLDEIETGDWWQETVDWYDIEPSSGRSYWLILLLADVDKQWYVGKPKNMSGSAKWAELDIMLFEMLN